MQVRHTNGKIYAVPDVPTLVKWIQDRRLARRCMVRFDDAEWMPILEIPEAATAFDALEVTAPPEEIPPAVDSAPQPETPEIESTQNPDTGDLEALDALAAEAEELSAPLEAVNSPAEETETQDDASSERAEPVPDELATDSVDNPDPVFESVLDESVAETDDDPFSMLDALDGSSNAGDDLGHDDFDDDFDDDDFDDDEKKPKSKLPLVAAIAVVLGLGGYFAFAGGGEGGFGGPIEMDPNHERLINNGILALASGDRNNMTKALTALGPAVCQGQCDQMKQCAEVGEKEKVCSPTPKAQAYVPAFLLADRLWRETATHMRKDQSLSKRFTELYTLLNAKKPKGKLIETLSYAEKQAFSHFYNVIIEPKKPAENDPIYAKLLGGLKGEDSSGNTMVFLALQAIDNGDIASAERFIKSAVSPGENKPADPGLMLFAQARLERARASDKCDAAKSAYKAADEKSLGFAAREGALFLASKGDLKGAAELVGAGAGSDPLLKGLKLASETNLPKSKKELKISTAKIWKKNSRGRILRYYMKKIHKPHKALEKSQSISPLYADLLEKKQSMFPYQIEDLVNSGWLASYHAEDKEIKAQAKADFVEKSAKRFNKALALDPGNRRALLGKSSMARFGVKDDEGSLTTAFYAWLFLSHEGLNAGTCAPSPPVAPTPAVAPAKPKQPKKRGKRKRRRGRRR